MSAAAPATEEGAPAEAPADGKELTTDILLSSSTWLKR